MVTWLILIFNNRSISSWSTLSLWNGYNQFREVMWMFNIRTRIVGYQWCHKITIYMEMYFQFISIVCKLSSFFSHFRSEQLRQCIMWYISWRHQVLSGFLQQPAYGTSRGVEYHYNPVRKHKDFFWNSTRCFFEISLSDLNVIENWRCHRA